MPVLDSRRPWKLRVEEVAATTGVDELVVRARRPETKNSKEIPYTDILCHRAAYA